MPRTPLLRTLGRRFRAHRAAAATGTPVDEVADRMRLSRRAFLGGTAAVTAGLALPFVLGCEEETGFRRRAARKPPSGSGPRIAIVGGGIAGLTAALTLRDAGVAATVYEATARPGGRMKSEGPTKPGCGSCHDVSRPRTTTWADDQYTDLFCELIDTSHTTMRGLCSRYGLPLIDILAAQPRGATDTFKFFGSYYPTWQADDDFAPVDAALRQDIHDAGYPTTYAQSTAGGRALDAMSIYDWIESRVPGGHSSPLGQLLDVAYVIEFGADSRDQSALNLVYLLGYNTGNRLSVFGTSDERFRVDGGIERLPRAMADDLGPDVVQLGCELEALSRQADGSYTLELTDRTTVAADFVIMALPFAVLRTLDIGAAGFDALKMTAIDELGRGLNAKHHIQFGTRLWNQPGPWGLSTGGTYADTGYQCTWDTTRGQPGASGILAVYTGGSVTAAQRQRHPYQTAANPDVAADTAMFMSQLELVFPGLSAQWNGRSAGSMPHLNRFWNCSYSYWRVGQYQKFAGYEAARQGNVFFCGEHTSVDFQGWMEGGAESGVRAADELLAAIGKQASLERSGPRAA